MLAALRVAAHDGVRLGALSLTVWLCRELTPLGPFPALVIGVVVAVLAGALVMRAVPAGGTQAEPDDEMSWGWRSVWLLGLLVVFVVAYSLGSAGVDAVADGNVPAPAWFRVVAGAMFFMVPFGLWLASPSPRTVWPAVPMAAARGVAAAVAVAWVAWGVAGIGSGWWRGVAATLAAAFLAHMVEGMQAARLITVVTSPVAPGETESGAVARIYGEQIVPARGLPTGWLRHQRPANPARNTGETAEGQWHILAFRTSGRQIVTSGPFLLRIGRGEDPAQWRAELFAGDPRGAACWMCRQDQIMLPDYVNERDD